MRLESHTLCPPNQQQPQQKNKQRQRIPLYTCDQYLFEHGIRITNYIYTLTYTPTNLYKKKHYIFTYNNKLIYIYIYKSIYTKAKYIRTGYSMYHRVGTHTRKKNNPTKPKRRLELLIQALQTKQTYNKYIPSQLNKTALRLQHPPETYSPHRERRISEVQTE